MIETILTLIYPVALGLLLGLGCRVWEWLNRGRRARARLERYIAEGRQG